MRNVLGRHFGELTIWNQDSVRGVEIRDTTEMCVTEVEVNLGTKREPVYR